MQSLIQQISTFRNVICKTIHINYSSLIKILFNNVNRIYYRYMKNISKIARNFLNI